MDAASRGFDVLLLESHDFGKGTSSRSTKLVHGGVRYLAQGNIALVKEALYERGLMAKNAAHLVKNQAFVIPNYSWWGGPFYMIGLTIYDFLAGKLSLGKTKYINKQKTIEKLPTIAQQQLSSGVVYQDGQFDDARLAINLVQTFAEQGGVPINYASVDGLIKDDQNQVIGVKATDRISGHAFEARGRVIVNATGVFSNHILKMDNPGGKKSIVPSQGIHLVLDRSFLPSDHALMIPKTSDGRVLFAVPWHDKVVVGTTDTPIDSESEEPQALEEEITFVLDTARKYLTKQPTREDVLSVFAGLRPLAAPQKEGKSTKEVSRSHKVTVSETGLVSIIGGKWTTYRKMSEDTVDAAISAKNLPKKACKTHQLPIHGNVPEDVVDRSNHLYIYGSDIAAIEQLQKESPALGELLHPNHPFTWAEVYWAIHQEMAQSVEDILARRVRLLFLDARAAIDIAPEVAQMIADAQNKGTEWVQKETNSFIELAKNYLLVKYKPKNKKSIHA